MNDSQYLQETINVIKFMSQTIPNYIAGVKNKDLEHLYISPYLAKITGAKKQYDLGKIALSEHYPLDKIEEDDLWVMEHRKNRQFFIMDRFNDELLPHIYIKRPLVNPITNNAIGIFYQATEYTKFNLNYEIIKCLLPYYQDSINNSEMENYRLSEREKQVIFFFLANFNSQEIAELLTTMNKTNICKSTIDSIFREQLYAKFKTVNRIELKIKLVKLGYDKMIPKNMIIPLFSSGDSCILL